MEKREIKKSKEDYLEAILIIIRKYGACRVTDIAEQIGYSKASVSVALKKLEADGCIKREDWRILLTKKGDEIAKHIYERHNFFIEWFKKIGIDPKTAEEDSCLIEHVLSDESFNKIRDFLQGLDERDNN